MFSGRGVRWVIHALDWATARVLPPEQIPEHQRIGRRGEEDAYFHLRKLGYVMVARNFRSPRHRGELDLIAWQHDVLCFVEVKTRTTRDVKPAELAVDYDKQRELRLVGREYLRLLTATPQYRFDIVTVYYEHGEPEFELFQNAFPVS
jgi:putative endonuclease